MNDTGMLLVWSVNLLTGLGLLVLGMAMSRRPEQLWVGVHVAQSPEETDRLRRGNRIASPWVIVLGAVELLSGPFAVLWGIPALTLAMAGLGTLVAAIGVLVVVALISR